MPSLKERIDEANHRAGVERQRTFARKSVVKLTSEQMIENLVTRAQEALDAFYKEHGYNAMREAMRNLQSAVRIAGKRARQG